MFKDIGFIGCGNMGGALLRAVVGALRLDEAGEKGLDASVKFAGSGRECGLYVSGRRPERAAAIAEETGAKACDNETIAKSCDLIFLGVKPQVMPEVLGSLAEIFAKRTEEKERFVLVTMAAGLSVESIRKMAGGDYPVIRIMPNLPVSVGEGTTLYCSQAVSGDELDDFLGLMKKSGLMVSIDESLIDAGSAVSGCGPAFVYMFIDALAEGGASCGLDKAQAQLLAAQTMIGSAKLLLESGRQPDDLKQSVCSPGGTTIEGVKSLDAAGFGKIASGAVIASYNRTLELKNNK